MGRPEGRLDTGSGPVAVFAQRLRDLRTSAQVTYRDMEAGSEFSASTLAHAASGKRFPSLRVVQAFVAACGGEVESWDQIWREASKAVAAAALALGDAAESPYRGLSRFEPGDHDLFFGRDDLTAQLARSVRDHHLVALVGASGSGKSSLVRAGLIPALRRESVSGTPYSAIRIFRPGAHPGSLPAELLKEGLGPGDTVVVIDQFEELFTLGADADERAAFVEWVITAVGQAEGRLRVVIAVRADFFGRCAEYRALAQALRDATLLVEPMGHAALREVIVKPAAAAGLSVERALTARLVSEAGQEPGSLPLLSHALLETWRRRRGRILTQEMYEASGGIHGAITATAEDVYSGLTEQQAAVAQRVLLRLISPGDGIQDTRRPTDRDELDAAAPMAHDVVEKLLRARLLTSDDNKMIDLAHEALITTWPRLKNWVEDNREQLRQHRLLTEAAHSWQALDHDPGALYRGARLTAADQAFPHPSRGMDLTSAEHAFLLASIAARRRERRGAVRDARRLRSLTIAVSLLVILCVTAGVLAWRQEARATSHRATASGRTKPLNEQNLLFTVPKDVFPLLKPPAHGDFPTQTPLGPGRTASLPIHVALDAIPVAVEKNTGYRQIAFGHVNDMNHDGCNTREEALKSKSIIDPIQGPHCLINYGYWYIPYDNTYSYDPSELDVVPLVPFAEAWASGASTWTQAQRQAYANDLADSRTLVVVSPKSNQPTAGQDPSTWLPSSSGYRCTYLADWIAVKTRWGMSIDPAEKTALLKDAAHCPNTPISITTAR